MRFRHARAAWADRAKRHAKDSTDSGTGGSGTGTPGTGRSGTARRAVLVGGAVGLGGAVVGYGLTRAGDASAKAPTAGPAPVSGRPAVQGRRALLMQVLAHPDDDLYFMNPDTQYALAAGTPWSACTSPRRGRRRQQDARAPAPARRQERVLLRPPPGPAAELRESAGAAHLHAME